jgi:hypothetical protein
MRRDNKKRLERKAMRRLVHAAAVAIATLLAGGPLGYAANTNCTSTLSGNLAGTVVVPTGASCTLSNATVTGDVQVRQNASLTLDATEQPTTIGGNVDAVNYAFALLEGGVTVTGDVQIERCLQLSGFIGPGVKIGVERPQRYRYIRHPRSSVNRHTTGRHILRAGILPGDRRSRD